MAQPAPHTKFLTAPPLGRVFYAADLAPSYNLSRVVDANGLALRSVGQTGQTSDAFSAPLGCDLGGADPAVAYHLSDVVDGELDCADGA
jgi:hypothetical protein